MKNSEIINSLMFDYDSFANKEELIKACNGLAPKILRWLATHHPDNRTRKVFLELTNVTIGVDTVINGGFVVSDDYKPLLTIGERVAISPYVTVVCSSSPNNSNLQQIDGFNEKYIKSLPVSIGDDSWIGSGVIVLPGVSIGRGCIVGAGAVVNMDIPDGKIVAGVPARVLGCIKSRS